jgi:hypothetical protein
VPYGEHTGREPCQLDLSLYSVVVEQPGLWEIGWGEGGLKEATSHPIKSMMMHRKSLLYGLLAASATKPVAMRAASACTSSLVGPLPLLLLLLAWRRNMVREGRVAGPRGCGEGRGPAPAEGERVDARRVDARLLLGASCATTRSGCATVLASIGLQPDRHARRTCCGEAWRRVNGGAFAAVDS